MLFHSGWILKSNRILLVLCPKSYGPSSFFLPLLDDLRIARYLDRSPVIIKRHPPVKSLFVKGPKSRLKRVIVRRSEEFTCESTACDRRKAALNRVLLDHVGFVVFI